MPTITGLGTVLNPVIFGEIQRFLAAPKTGGFEHYLNNLPMNLVGSIGYVDRGIGKNGIFYHVDDFIGTSVGFKGSSSGDALQTAVNGNYNWTHAGSVGIAPFNYLSGAFY